MGKTVYWLKATIMGTKPSVWRRVIVPGEITLAGLHDVLQAAFGWWDCHLHEFEIGGVRYGVDDGEDGHPPQNERRTRQCDVAVADSSFVYVYDFGDDWRHKVTVEKVLPASPNTRYPLCTDGRRACPPEDCGGTWGYRQFLTAIRDPGHAGHESMLEWVGGQFDSEAFDIGEFEHRLQLGRLSAR
jgi:Plasmid pRiA4b ORF-3-like protein